MIVSWRVLLGVVVLTLQWAGARADGEPFPCSVDSGVGWVCTVPVGVLQVDFANITFPPGTNIWMGAGAGNSVLEFVGSGLLDMPASSLLELQNLGLGGAGIVLPGKF